MSASSSSTPSPPPKVHDWRDVTPPSPKDTRQLGEIMNAVGPGTTPPNTPNCSTPDPRAGPVDDVWAMKEIKGEELRLLKLEMARLDAECEEWTPESEKARRIKEEAEAAAAAEAAAQAANAGEGSSKQTIKDPEVDAAQGLSESLPKYPKHPPSRPFLVRPIAPQFENVLYMGSKLDTQWRGNRLRLLKLAPDEWILKETLSEFPLFTLHLETEGGLLSCQKQPVIYLYEGSYFKSQRPNPVGSFRVLDNGAADKDFVITVMPDSHPSSDKHWWKPEACRKVVRAPKHMGYGLPFFCGRHRAICDAHWFRVPMGRWTDAIHMEVPMVWRAGKDHCELLRHDIGDYPRLVARWASGNLTTEPLIPFAELQFMMGVSFNGTLGDPFVRLTALTAVKFLGIWEFDSLIQNR